MTCLLLLKESWAGVMKRPGWPLRSVPHANPPMEAGHLPLVSGVGSVSEPQGCFIIAAEAPRGSRASKKDQASPEPLLSGSQATDREAQSRGPIAFLSLHLPGWPSCGLLSAPLGAVSTLERTGRADVCQHKASDPLCLGFRSRARGSGCCAGM